MQPQIDLFEKNEQVKQLERVKSKLLKEVINYCTMMKSKNDGKFFMVGLVDWCMEVIKCSPDSPSRILREARKEEWLDYEVLSRSKSLYKILWIK